MRLVPVCLLVFAATASALSVDEVVELAEAGVSDEIILNQMKADGSAFELTARQIVDLQKKKVSPAVINFMVQARGKAPVPQRAEPMPIPREKPMPEEAKDATVTLRNVTSGPVTVMAYPRDRQLAFVKGEISSGIVLLNGSHHELALPAGVYKVRWAAEDSFREVVIAGGVTNELEFRTDDRTLRGIGVAMILDGKVQGDPTSPPEVSEGTEEPGEAEPLVYQSPTNSSVTVIRDVQQVPTRVVVVPGTSSYAAEYYPEYAASWGYSGSASYVVRPSSSCYRPVVRVCDSYPRYSWGLSIGHSGHHYGHSYGHRSHGYTSHRSYGNARHHGHYSRTADNIQYYLRWPFGHRHR